MIQGGVAPLNPPQGTCPKKTPRLASKANWPDASLGIELVLGIARGSSIIIRTRSNESACSDELCSERWVKGAFSLAGS